MKITMKTKILFTHYKVALMQARQLEYEEDTDFETYLALKQMFRGLYERDYISFELYHYIRTKLRRTRQTVEYCIELPCEKRVY